MFSKFEFCGYLNLWVFKICGYSNLWVHKICDDTKFQVSGREYQNICVLCISCEQKNICGFFHICFLPYVQNIPCELGLSVAPVSTKQSAPYSPNLAWTNNPAWLVLLRQTFP